MLQTRPPIWKTVHRNDLGTSIRAGLSSAQLHTFQDATPNGAKLFPTVILTVGLCCQLHLFVSVREGVYHIPVQNSDNMGNRNMSWLCLVEMIFFN